MTVQKLIDELSKLPQHLEVYGVHGASGCSYEVSCPRVHNKTSLDDIGPLCELEDDIQVVVISLD